MMSMTSLMLEYGVRGNGQTFYVTKPFTQPAAPDSSSLAKVPLVLLQKSPKTQISVSPPLRLPASDLDLTASDSDAKARRAWGSNFERLSGRISEVEHLRVLRLIKKQNIIGQITVSSSNK